MSDSPREPTPQGRIGFFSFAIRLVWFCLRHLAPRYGLGIAVMLAVGFLSFRLAEPRVDGGWELAIPAAVLVFGGIGVFAARTTRRDLLVQRLLERDLVVGRSSGVPSRRLGAVHGTIRAIDGPLRSPLGQVECVAYQYSISVPLSLDSGTSLEAAYEGYGLTPAEIVGSEGRYRLVAFPDLREFEHESGSRIRARRYVGEITTTRGLPVIDDWHVRERLRREAVDRLQIDLQTGEVTDWTQTEVEESALPEGTRACVIGLVDVEDRAVYPPYSRTRQRVWVFPGTPDQVLHELREDSGFGAGCAVLFLTLAGTVFLLPAAPLAALAVGLLGLLALRFPRRVLAAFASRRAGPGREPRV